MEQTIFVKTTKISIHSLRVEGDTVVLKNDENIKISIHSLRVEGDTSKPSRLVLLQLFQSTPSV